MNDERKARLNNNLALCIALTTVFMGLLMQSVEDNTLQIIMTLVCVLLAVGCGVLLGISIQLNKAADQKEEQRATAAEDEAQLDRLDPLHNVDGDSK